MGYEEIMRFEFQTPESAKAAMDECDSFEVWDAVRSCSGGLYITTAVRDLQRVLQVMAKYGGKKR